MSAGLASWAATDLTIWPPPPDCLSFRRGWRQKRRRIHAANGLPVSGRSERQPWARATAGDGRHWFATEANRRRPCLGCLIADGEEWKLRLEAPAGTVCRGCREGSPASRDGILELGQPGRGSTLSGVHRQAMAGLAFVIMRRRVQHPEASHPLVEDATLTRRQPEGVTPYVSVCAAGAWLPRLERAESIWRLGAKRGTKAGMNVVLDPYGFSPMWACRAGGAKICHHAATTDLSWHAQAQRQAERDGVCV